jgi:hypothetical protein
MAPNLSLILDTAFAAFGGGAPDQRGAHDPSRTGFNLQQLELHASAAVDPFFRFDANLVFALFGVEIEEAYVTSLALPGGLQARAGQFLTRFGRRNPARATAGSAPSSPGSPRCRGTQRSSSRPPKRAETAATGAPGGRSTRRSPARETSPGPSR